MPENKFSWQFNFNFELARDDYAGHSKRTFLGEEVKNLFNVENALPSPISCATTRRLKGEKEFLVKYSIRITLQDAAHDFSGPCLGQIFNYRPVGRFEG